MVYSGFDENFLRKLSMTDIVIQPFSEIAQQNAEQVASEVDWLLDQIHAHELRLGSSYARLGALLLEVKKNQYWITYGYQRFGSYMDFVRGKIDRRRSQVYEFLSVAEALLPYLTEGQLEDIGITKAHELKRFVKMSLVRPPVQLMDAALDPKITSAELRVEVNKILHHEEEPQGRWRDLGGAYWADEEWAEYQQAFELARRVDPPIPINTPDHVVLKIVLSRFSQEFIGTYSEEIP